jgi:Family of unknown function (DUF6510)
MPEPEMLEPEMPEAEMPDAEMSDNFVDGNALGGTFREVFAVDITAARGRCASCGSVNPIGTTRVYSLAAGSVARCVHCDDVVIKVVNAPDRVFLNFAGLSFLEIALPDSPILDEPL